MCSAVSIDVSGVPAVSVSCVSDVLVQALHAVTYGHGVEVLLLSCLRSAEALLNQMVPWTGNADEEIVSEWLKQLELVASVQSAVVVDAGQVVCL